MDNNGVNEHAANGYNGVNHTKAYSGTAQGTAPGMTVGTMPAPDIDLDARYNANLKTHQKGLSPSDMAAFYSSWSSKYEQDLCPGVYNGPEIVAQEMCALYQKGRDKLRILDVASGTGLLGEKLYQHGFRNIDALDPSEGMLEISKQKHAYENFICEFISEKELDIPKGRKLTEFIEFPFRRVEADTAPEWSVDTGNTGTYDTVVISGGFGESHIPRSALHEMIRLVKPGGYICSAMRKEYLEYVEEYNENKLEDLMERLQCQGRWKKIVRKVVPNYSFCKDGVVFLFQVL